MDLAAQDGLALFGVVDEPDEQELLMKAMDLSKIVQPPNGSTVNLTSITQQVHVLVVHVGSSPQCAKEFANKVELSQSLSNENKNTTNSVLDDTGNMNDLALQGIFNGGLQLDFGEPPKSSPPDPKQTSVKLVIDVNTR